MPSNRTRAFFFALRSGRGRSFFFATRSDTGSRSSLPSDQEAAGPLLVTVKSGRGGSFSPFCPSDAEALSLHQTQRLLLSIGRGGAFSPFLHQAWAAFFSFPSIRARGAFLRFPHQIRKPVTGRLAQTRLAIKAMTLPVSPPMAPT